MVRSREKKKTHWMIWLQHPPVTCVWLWLRWPWNNLKTEFLSQEETIKYLQHHQPPDGHPLTYKTAAQCSSLMCSLAMLTCIFSPSLLINTSAYSSAVPAYQIFYLLIRPRTGTKQQSDLPDSFGSGFTVMPEAKPSGLYGCFPHP